ncbi:MAG: prenyltransferase/squalene oxidase repeat-containing protein [Bythopirellula sp.]
MRLLIYICCAFSVTSLAAHAADEASSHEVLTQKEWDYVNRSVDRALEWIVSQQNPNGSFPTQQTGQPAVTSLCVMAFLAQGHLPGEGRYGDSLKRALDYIVSCQKRNGILADIAPNGNNVSRQVQHHIGYTVSYNHAIAGLVLAESYAMVGSESTAAIGPVIQEALDVSYLMQDWPNEREVDEGGWRYLDDYEDHENDGKITSDLSITGWQLMFLRSAKNAGFDVEADRIERAVGYVRGCFLTEDGTFTYKLVNRNRASRGMAGAGILALAHSGLHNTPEAQRAGDWLLRSGFESYNAPGRVTGSRPRDDRYFYGLLTSSQAMYQLGGRHWREFFPPMAKVLIANQNNDGSWDAEQHHLDGAFGRAYTTAIGVLALSASNQLLPIFQR